MFNLFLSYLCFTILFVCGIARAESLTLDAAVAEVLARNPDIIASRYRVEATKARITDRGSFDDPRIGIMFDDVPTNTIAPNDAEEIDYRIEQRLPFPGKLGTKASVARAEAGMETANSQAVQRRVVRELKRTYYAIYRLDRALDVSAQLQELIEQFYASAKATYAAGQSSADAPIRAQLELLKLKNEVIRLTQQRIGETANLRALLNRNTAHDEPVVLPKPLIWPKLSHSLDEYQMLAVQNRSELIGLNALREREERQRTVAKQSLLPDFDLSLQYGDRQLGQDTWTGAVMLNVPIFFWSKNRAQIIVATANRDAAKAEYDAELAHTVHMLESAFTLVSSSQERVANFENEILGQAKVNLEASRVAYRANRIPFLTVIDAARSYQELHLAYFESQEQLGNAFAELESLVGGQP